jgi:hypothetical protein
MASLQAAVFAKFIETLEADETFDSAKIEKLKDCLLDEKKTKADDLVDIFSLPDGGEVL